MNGSGSVSQTTGGVSNASATGEDDGNYSVGSLAPTDQGTGGTSNQGSGFENGTDSQGGLTSIEDEQVPLSDGSTQTGKRTSLFGRAFGSPGDCMIHWLILLGIMLCSLYTFLRCQYIRGKELIQEHFLWDTLIYMIPLPLAAIAWLWQYCRLDLPLLIVWIFIVFAGLYADKKAFKNNLNEVESELLLLERGIK